MHRRQAVQLAAALPVGLLTRSSARACKKRSPFNAPAPKFQAWDLVWHEYTVDDDLNLEDNGKTFRVFGIVIGMVFNSESHSYRGWSYHVMTRRPKSLTQPWNSDSYWHESEMSLTNVSDPMFGEFEVSPTDTELDTSKPDRH